jgi:hypothetical protein
MKLEPKTDVRKRYTNNVSNLKQFRYYKKHYENTLSKELFNKVWVDFIEGDKKNNITGVIDKMIFENFEFKLPFKMGSIRIKKNKVKPKLDSEGKLITDYLPIDWETSRDIKQKTFLTNQHTMGYVMKWYWNKNEANFKNKRYYTLNVVRTLDRYLAKALKNPENHLDYYL